MFLLLILLNSYAILTAFYYLFIYSHRYFSIMCYSLSRVKEHIFLKIILFFMFLSQVSPWMSQLILLNVCLNVLTLLPWSTLTSMGMTQTQLCDIMSTFLLNSSFTFLTVKLSSVWMFWKLLNSTFPILKPSVHSN